MYYVLLTFFLLIYTITEAKVMSWIPNLNYENPDNWLPKHVPCPNDRVIYPLSMNAEVQLTKNDISVREIVLPMFGSIKLTDKGILQLSDLNKELVGCHHAGDVYFKKEIKNSWLDVDSWSPFDGEKPHGGEAIPHYDRLPCVYDTVFFPPDKSFVLQLPKYTYQIKSVIFENEMISSNKWNNILRERSLTFHPWPYGDVPAVEIRRDTSDCSKDDICFCQLTDIPDELCVNEKPKCPPIKCLHPVKPKNHCCDICGSVLQVKIDEKFNYHNLKKTVEDTINDYNIENVDYYMGPILESLNDQYMQIVIVDMGEYDGRSVKLGNYLLDSIVGDVNGRYKAQIKVAGIPWKGTDTSLGGWEAIIMFLIIGLIIIGLIIYYYPPAFMANVNNLFRPYEFARFDNRSREGSLMLGISHLSLDKAFDNPMYNKAAKSYKEEFDDKDDNLTETEAVDESDHEQDIEDDK